MSGGCAPPERVRENLAIDTWCNPACDPNPKDLMVINPKKWVRNICGSLLLVHPSSISSRSQTLSSAFAREHLLGRGLSPSSKRHSSLLPDLIPPADLTKNG